MKRVLNSGYIKLNNIIGSEKKLYEQIEVYKMDDPSKLVFESGLLSNIVFVFEIKAPVLLLLQTFQKAHLGTLETFLTSDVSEAYIPPFFYKFDPSGFKSMGDKDCNDLFSKYSNFYRSVVNFYHKLLEKGVCSSEAQLILPQGLLTTFLLTINAQDLIAFIEQNKDDSPETYGYCEVLHVYLSEQLPEITKWIQLNKPII
jgi:hypothetical protein